MGKRFSDLNEVDLLGQKIKNPSIAEMMVVDAVDDFIAHVISVSEKALEDEFGFGKERITQFRKAFEKAKHEVNFLE